MNTEKLSRLASDAKQEGLKALFENPDRVSELSYQVAGIYADLSKTHLNDDVLDAYAQLAEELEFEEKRRQQFAGEKINVTEDRAVLHTLLRNTEGTLADGMDQSKQQAAQQTQQQLLMHIDRLRKQHIEVEAPIKSIIHIGIGGSSLGPQLLFEALAGLDNTIDVHFVSNVDAHQIVAVLNKCDPASTLIFGVSKTFTTKETLMNIETVKAWVQAADGVNFEERFFAITASEENALKFGVNGDNIAVFPQWVGGRFSIWSAVSLSVALVLGRDSFAQFLAGAAQMDEQFYSQPARQNLAFLLASLDHFYGNFFDAGSRATFAYDNRLFSLVPYLQQLETESNGKDRTLDGEPVQNKTAPVVWGGTGTDMQHSTFQLLHQGTHFIPVEFILVKNADHSFANHHDTLLANGIAQSAALMRGRSLAEVEQLADSEGLSDKVKKAKVFAGEKPSTTFLLETLSAHSLGALLALYEHRTFCFGVLNEINSYDQMGVELGKQLANEIEPILRGEASDSDFDASTLNLVSKLASSS